MVAPRQDVAGLGIVLMLIAWLLFSGVDTSVKWLVGVGLPVFQLSFMRYVVHFGISAAVTWRAGSFSTLRLPKYRGLILLRSGLLVTATLMNFYALTFLPLTITSAIMFSSPIIVSALSAPLLGERVKPWRWFAIFVGFAGVVIVVRPFGAEFHWASILIVYNAFAMALFSIITRRLSGLVSESVMQFYMSAIGTLVLIPAAFLVWQNPETSRDWLLMFGIGVFAWAGHELFARCHRYAAANTLMPYSYSYIIYLTIASYLVFGDLPDGFTIAGAAIIVLSGLGIWWHEDRERSPHVRP